MRPGKPQYSSLPKIVAATGPAAVMAIPHRLNRPAANPGGTTTALGPPGNILSTAANAADGEYVESANAGIKHADEPRWNDNQWPVIRVRRPSQAGKSMPAKAGVQRLRDAGFAQTKRRSPQAEAEHADRECRPTLQSKESKRAGAGLQDRNRRFCRGAVRARR